MDFKLEKGNQDSVKSIKPINGETVHKICSGQVVLNLAIAVKELVENSLDAGATIVDVRLKNYGIDLIEVSDNGSGVTEDNFAALTLKYHTSKLTDYSDLLGVKSFGFRGEALSSLCALANIQVTTRHTNTVYATKIEYDSKGNIVKSTPCSRQVGTTVTLSNLFSSLPVRQKEFHKNAKREFNKMTQLLYSYCLVSLGVKITCTNTTTSNSKSVVVATNGSNSYRDNIANVFGSKQLQTILELKPEYVSNIKDNILKGMSTESQEINDTVNIEDIDIDLSEDSNDTEDNDIESSQISPKSQGHTNGICPVKFTGFISSCAHGAGRSSTDRQFYYVNSRPCEPPKIIKLINDIYKQYNPHQYPFVFLNVDLDRATVDVNVTPDKRKVFLTKEKIILDVIKASLAKIFENIPRTLKVDSLDKFIKNEARDKQPELSQPRIFNSFMQKFASKTNKVGEPQDALPNVTDLKRKSTTMLNFISTKSSRKDQDDNPKINDTNELVSDTDVKLENLGNDNQNKSNLSLEQEHSSFENKSDEKTVVQGPLNLSGNSFSKHLDNDKIESNLLVKREKRVSEVEYQYKINSSADDETMIKTENLEHIDNKNDSNLQLKREKRSFDEDETLSKDNKNKITKMLSNSSENEIMYLESTDNLPQTQIRMLEDVVLESHTIYCKTPKLKAPYLKTKIAPKKIATDKDIAEKPNKKCVTLKTCLDHVKALHDIYQKQNHKSLPNRIRFRSQINPVFNNKCEEELSKEISKESFKEMAVVGQFNLGFIITRLDEDLFIIDQHATDEIYNFETLQKTTELTSQKLVVPQQLELTGVNEQILMDNLQIFKKNGFTFEIDPEALPTKRVKLLTLPMSKNWVFGKEDIEELLFMLRESTNEECRPSRVRAMFASRACRKSVMIGTALNKGDMKALVNHMAEIDKPWNCPHGRPTIRHLVNLAMVHIRED